MRLPGVPAQQKQDIIPSRVDRLRCVGIMLAETLKTDLVTFINGDFLDNHHFALAEARKQARIRQRMASFLHDKGHILINPENYNS